VVSEGGGGRTHSVPAPLEPLALVLCNAPPDDALRIARALVERRLVACVNIVPGVTSVYRWKGDVQVDAESTMLLKTRAALVPQLTIALLELHPYDLPEVVALPLDMTAGNLAYLAWVQGETQPA
jgi:periplasmic divalent cation tolerance protein